MGGDRFLSCPICFEQYCDDNPCVPMVIATCGHTVCKVCLEALPDECCPLDRIPLKKGECCPNYALLDVILHIKGIPDISAEEFVATLSKDVENDTESPQNGDFYEDHVKPALNNARESLQNGARDVKNYTNAKVIPKLQEATRYIGHTAVRTSDAVSSFTQEKIKPRLVTTSAAVKDFTTTKVVPIVVSGSTQVKSFATEKVAPAIQRTGLEICSFTRSKVVPIFQNAGTEIARMCQTSAPRSAQSQSS